VRQGDGALARALVGWRLPSIRGCSDVAMHSPLRRNYLLLSAKSLAIFHRGGITPSPV